MEVAHFQLLDLGDYVERLSTRASLFLQVHPVKQTIYQQFPQQAFIFAVKLFKILTNPGSYCMYFSGYR